MGIHEDKIEGVPQFVSYFGPLLETLRDLGGQARPKQIYGEIVKRYNIPDTFLDEKNKNGQSKFQNRVAWAKFYLCKAGLMTSPKRGVWTLTDEGRVTELSSVAMAHLFHTVKAPFKDDEDEQRAPDDQITTNDVNYWFVDAICGQNDQTEQFLLEGVWHQTDRSTGAQAPLHQSQLSPNGRQLGVELPRLKHQATRD